MISKKTLTILISSLLFFVSALSVSILIWYYTAQKGSELSDKTKEIATIQSQSQAMVSLAKLIEETTDERTQLASYILQSEDIPEFVTFIETFATEQGVDIKTKKLEEIDSKDGELHGGLILEVALEGSKNALIKVIKMAELLPYHSYVSEIELQRVLSTKTISSEWKGLIRFNITLAGI